MELAARGLTGLRNCFVVYRGHEMIDAENRTRRWGSDRTRTEGMYLISVFEKEGIVEASLGGRVTADEICVLAGEISDKLEESHMGPMQLLLDYSRAKRMDPKSLQALNELKDLVFEFGVAQIVSVMSDEGERSLHQSSRLQMVLEGREKFVHTGAEFEAFKAAPAVQLRIAA